MLIKSLSILVELFWASALVRVMWCLGQKTDQLLKAEVVIFDSYLMFFWPSDIAVIAWPLMLLVWRVLFHNEFAEYTFFGLVAGVCFGSLLLNVRYILHYEYLPWLAPVKLTIPGMIFNVAVVSCWFYWIWKKLRSKWFNELAQRE